MADKKKSFKAGFNKLKTTGDAPRMEVTTHIPKTKKKMGRPTTKDPNTQYVRVSVDMPIEMRTELKRILYSGGLSDQYPTQNDLILGILETFIQNNK